MGVHRRHLLSLTPFVLIDCLLFCSFGVAQMWVSASAATEDLFDTTIQPILDSYRPAGVSALGFKKVSLGTIPPKVLPSFGCLFFFFFVCSLLVYDCGAPQTLYAGVCCFCFMQCTGHRALLRGCCWAACPPPLLTASMTGLVVLISSVLFSLARLFCFCLGCALCLCVSAPGRWSEFARWR